MDVTGLFSADLRIQKGALSKLLRNCCSKSSCCLLRWALFYRKKKPWWLGLR
ncbi:hypothetical protein J6590_040296, partial [Homalodisca vitripennis]